jgi:hypothetical protein
LSNGFPQGRFVGIDSNSTSRCRARAMTPALQIANIAGRRSRFLRDVEHAVGAKLDGIVGYNFLRNYKVVIDYPNEILSLF